MRYLYRLLAMSLVIGSISILSAPSASAWTCSTRSLDDEGIFRNTVCLGWDGGKGGAKLNDPRSSYLQDNATGASTELLLTGTLKDRRANGKCAYLRVKRTDSVLNFNRIQVSACGSGESERFSRSFQGPNATSGRYTVLLCNGKRNCKAVFNQVIR